MSPERNQKIVELLKRYAEKRRAESGAEFELHPASRRVLQGEVSRTFVHDRTKPKTVLRLGPRLAFIGVFTALFAFAVLQLNTPRNRAKQTMSLAANKDAAAQNKFFADTEKISKLDPDRSAFAKKEMSAKRISVPRGAAREMTRAGEPSVNTPASPLPVPKRLEEVATGKTPPATELAKTISNSASKIGSGAAPGFALASTAASLEDERSFVQKDLQTRYRQNLLSPPQPKILQAFKLIQSGNHVQLVDDDDGSVYEGKIVPPANRTDKTLNGGVEKEFAFRVEGINQKLHQTVTVTGVLNAATDSLGLRDESVFGTAGELKQKSVPKNLLLHGRVSIGSTNNFEILATEVRK